MRETRGVSFEDIASRILMGGLLDSRSHSNKEKYEHQKIFIVEMKEYAYIVPYVESEYEIFLKTIIPSRKETKRYLGGEK